MEIRPGVVISDQEFWWEAATSPGPGGQHVNTSRTQAILCFHLDSSPSLDEAQKHRIRRQLANRISKEGILRIPAHEHRSLHRNKDEALARFHDLLAEALKPRVRRKPTRPSFGSQQRRLEQKSQRAAIKRQRRKPGLE